MRNMRSVIRAAPNELPAAYEVYEIGARYPHALPRGRGFGVFEDRSVSAPVRGFAWFWLTR